MKYRSAFDKTSEFLRGNGPKPTRRELAIVRERYERRRECGVELSPYMIALLKLEGLL